MEKKPPFNKVTEVARTCSRMGSRWRYSIVFVVVCVFSLVICQSGCGPAVVISTNDKREVPIDFGAARGLSDSLAVDLIGDRRAEIRQNLEQAFRDAVDEKQFNAILDQMIEAYGKPLEFEFKQSEMGTREYDNGQTKPVRKFWYAARTTKYDKGSHFLIIEIVIEDRVLAVSSFAIVDFPSGIPPGLK